MTTATLAPCPRTPSTPRSRRAPDPRRQGPHRPDPQRLALLLVTLWLEVRCGRRPLTQLTPLIAPALRRRLVAQLPARSQRSTAGVGRARRVTVHHPSPDAAEAVVLVEHDGRTTAIALRLERHEGCWRAVELSAPESGLPPVRTASRPRTSPA